MLFLELLNEEKLKKNFARWLRQILKHSWLLGNSALNAVSFLVKSGSLSLHHCTNLFVLCVWRAHYLPVFSSLAFIQNVYEKEHFTDDKHVKFYEYNKHELICFYAPRLPLIIAQFCELGETLEALLNDVYNKFLTIWIFLWIWRIIFIFVYDMSPSLCIKQRVCLYQWCICFFELQTIVSEVWSQRGRSRCRLIPGVNWRTWSCPPVIGSLTTDVYTRYEFPLSTTSPTQSCFFIIHSCQQILKLKCGERVPSK